MLLCAAGARSSHSSHRTAACWCRTRRSPAAWPPTATLSTPLLSPMEHPPPSLPWFLLAGPPWCLAPDLPSLPLPPPPQDQMEYPLVSYCEGVQHFAGRARISQQSSGLWLLKLPVDQWNSPFQWSAGPVTYTSNIKRFFSPYCRNEDVFICVAHTLDYLGYFTEQGQ